jgi:hypothetical protein
MVLMMKRDAWGLQKAFGKKNEKHGYYFAMVALMPK